MNSLEIRSVYDVDTMFPISNSALYHARKKLMMAGGKSELKDLEEALISLKEGITIMKHEAQS